MFISEKENNLKITSINIRNYCPIHWSSRVAIQILSCLSMISPEEDFLCHVYVFTPQIISCFLSFMGGRTLPMVVSLSNYAHALST